MSVHKSGCISRQMALWTCGCGGRFVYVKMHCLLLRFAATASLTWILSASLKWDLVLNMTSTANCSPLTSTTKSITSASLFRRS